MPRWYVFPTLFVLVCWPFVLGDQPPGCGDWVSDEPGLTCVDEWPPRASMLVPAVFDNEGHVLYARVEDIGNCGEEQMTRIEVVRFDGSSESVIGHLDSRCLDPSISKLYQVSLTKEHPLLFDATNGVLLVSISDTCICLLMHGCSEMCDPPEKNWYADIGGFTTLFEIMQTYDPEHDRFSFRVPVMPEGLDEADSFDTYWGALGQPLDMAAAHPLRCAYPEEPPTVGQRLDFPNSAPLPAAGSGFYYLTAVNRGGDRRAGREVLAGNSSGREAASLPPCELLEGRRTTFD